MANNMKDCETDCSVLHSIKNLDTGKPVAWLLAFQYPNYLFNVAM